LGARSFGVMQQGDFHKKQSKGIKDCLA